MRFRKIYNFVMEYFIKGYGLINENIKKLEEQKEEGKSGDINSYIRSINKINRSVENEVIKNITIEDNINTLLKWKNIIDSVVEEISKDKKRGEIINYRLHTTFSEEVISELCNVGRRMVNTTIKDFINEVVLIAVDERLIELKNIKVAHFKGTI